MTLLTRAIALLLTLPLLACSDSGELGRLGDASSRDAGVVLDASDAGDADAEGDAVSIAESSVADASAGPGGDASCGASANVRATRRASTAWLVIERTWTMCAASPPVFGDDRSIWSGLRGLLLGSEGLIPSYEQAVAFGLVFHGAQTPGPCPVLSSVPPALAQTPIIEQAYPDELYDNLTATCGAAAAATHAGLEVVEQMLPPRASDPSAPVPVVIVARSDATETLCTSSPDLDTADRLTREVAARLAARGTRLFVLRLPRSEPRSRGRDDELAAIGGTERAYQPMDIVKFREAFASMLRDAVSCEVTLNGSVNPGQECRGSVWVDGQPVPCNTPNGWHLKDSRTIELTGDACVALRDRPSALVKADFPCDAIVLL